MAAHPPAAEALIARLRDPDASVRAVAARDLGKSRDPRAAAPLTGLLLDPEPMVRAQAAAALGRLGPAAAPAALAALAATLGDPLAPVRFWACDALGRLGPDARDALPALEAVRDRPTEPAVVRLAAGRAAAAVRGGAPTSPSDPPPSPSTRGA